MRLRLIIIISVVVLSVVAYLSFSGKSIASSQKKIPVNGVSLVSPPQKVSPSLFGGVEKTNANWVALIPFGFSRKGQPNVSFDHERQWWGERSDGTCELIKCSQDYDLKVLLKPHVWVMGQGWPGEYDLTTEEDWQIWEQGYRQYILNHARIADSMKVDMFCVGTEFRIAGVKREAFWRTLIRDVRQVYQGPLTYASNWDNYDKIQFWDELDYIGIDAYFPVSENPAPSVTELEAGWQPVKKQLEQFSKRADRPILFTEYGYQSLTGTAGKHWEIDKGSDAINMQAQADAYQALYNVFWDESWFAGGFLWKWHLRKNYGGPSNGAFTPQGKTAEVVIQSHFGSYLN
ncbi:MAG: hypothetical protein R8G66_20480 [Cytophagales bacterium]|nr:hypothetical protein [Cytophagales bacterium]